jgi:phage internal scaffolding protein
MNRITKSPYDYGVDLACVIDCSKDPKIVQQQFANEVDINTIVDKFTRTGLIDDTLLSNRTAVFSDVSDLGDYHSALIRVEAVEEAFMTLPADVRARFVNDPGELLDFIADSKNYDEAVKIGLIAPKAQASVAAVAPVVKADSEAVVPAK